MSAAAKNLEAIKKAIIRHNGNCEFPLLAIYMAPFEVERLGWDEFEGIPIREDEKMPTGRFRLECDGQHDTAPELEREVVAAGAGPTPEVELSLMAELSLDEYERLVNPSDDPGELIELNGILLWVLSLRMFG